MKRIRSVIILVFLLAGHSEAIINPNFTPRHLVDEAAFAFAGPVQPGADAMHWRMTNAEPLKGESAKTHEFDLTACNKDHLAAVQAAFKNSGTSPAALFAGTRAGQRGAYLHVGNRWVALKQAAEGKWHVVGSAANMAGTFAGATDKLIRMVRHLVADPDADVPIGAQVRWIDSVTFGRSDGPCSGLTAVERTPGGKIHLFLASAAGDRLFRQKGDQDDLEDITAAAKLTSRSRRFAWMDVNRDGLADLLSWDGRVLRVLLGTAKGTFTAAGDAWSIKQAEASLAISPLGFGGSAAIVISTPSSPRLYVAEQGGWRKRPLPAGGPKTAAALGPAAACIVADLDNDGHADILQPRQGGGLLWKGTATGFAAPVLSAVKHAGEVPPVLADFDGDGSIDLFLAGRTRNGLWENDGKGGFTEVIQTSGSLSYKCPAGANDVKAMDLNHDGRADLCLVYARGDLLYHWSRGFGALAEEGEVRLTAARAAPGEPSPGQRALAAGDFNNDGSQDLAVLLTDGRLQCYFNDHMDMPGVRIRLPKGTAGCVTASGWMGTGKARFCIGTVVVRGHVPSAYLSARYAGTLTLRRSTPAGPVSQTIEVDEGTVSLILAPAQK